MGAQSTNRCARQKLHAIQQAKRLINERIGRILRRLDELERHPDTQPFISFGKVKRIQDLRGRHRSLREALHDDLALLRTELSELKGRIPRLRRIAAKQNAEQASEKLRNRLLKALKDAERGGALDEATLTELLAESEKVLEMHIDILERNPGPINIKAVLKNTEIPMMLGSDSDVVNRATDSAGRAAQQIRQRIEDDFRKHPGADNFERLLKAKESEMLLRGSSPQKPTGWKPSPPNTLHVVAPGESLSSISGEHYGNLGYWDLIYMANAGVIGDKPEQLRVGIKLVIP